MEFEISHTATSRICSAKVFLKDFSKFKGKHPFLLTREFDENILCNFFKFFKILRILQMVTF